MNMECDFIIFKIICRFEVTTLLSTRSYVFRYCHVTNFTVNINFQSEQSVHCSHARFISSYYLDI